MTRRAIRGHEAPPDLLDRLTLPRRLRRKRALPKEAEVDAVSADERAAQLLADQLSDDELDHKPVLAGFFNAVPFAEPSNPAELRTCTPSQLRFMLLALDVTRTELSRQFAVKPTAVQAWLDGRALIPAGIAAYLRLRVIARIRALSIGAGTPVSTETDYEDRVSVTAIDTLKRLWQNTQAFNKQRAQDLNDGALFEQPGRRAGQAFTRVRGEGQGQREAGAQASGTAAPDPLSWMSDPDLTVRTPGV